MSLPQLGEDAWGLKMHNRSPEEQINKSEFRFHGHGRVINH